MAGRGEGGEVRQKNRSKWVLKDGGSEGGKRQKEGRGGEEKKGENKALNQAQECEREREREIVSNLGGKSTQRVHPGEGAL